MWLILGCILGYAILAIITCHGLRFTRHAREDPLDGEPQIYIAAVFWPAGIPLWIIAEGLHKIARSDWLSRMDYRVAKLRRTKVHEDQYGVLYQLALPKQDQRVVRVEDSTGVYWIPVPPDMVRAKQAVAWTYNLSEDDFHPVRI